MTWLNAWLRGLAVFFYFVIATVWLPDLVIKLDAVAGASSFLRDLIVLIVWGGGLVAGLFLLRIGQRKGLV